MEKKRKSRKVVKNLFITFLISLVLLSSIQFVGAQRAQDATSLVEKAFQPFPGGSILSKFVLVFTGTKDILTSDQFLVWLAMFVIIFVAFSDLIETFSTFSSNTSWIIGFALTIIFASTGALASAAVWVFQIVAIFGAFALAVIILSGFVAAMVVHLGFQSAGGWIHNRILMMKASKGDNEALAGLRTLRDVGRGVTR